MIDRSSARYRDIFFERRTVAGGNGAAAAPASDATAVPDSQPSPSPWVLRNVPEYRSIVPSVNPRDSLSQRIRADTHRRQPQPNSATSVLRTYDKFEDLIFKMLAFDPQQRIQPLEALRHPFITELAEASAPTAQMQQPQQHPHGSSSSSNTNGGGEPGPGGIVGDGAAAAAAAPR
jgi:serine/threonine protein kinase